MQDDRVGMAYAIDVAIKTTASADCVTLVAKASRAVQNKTAMIALTCRSSFTREKA